MSSILPKALSRAHYLILMDVEMPEIDGFTATRHIGESEKANGRPAVPIIAFTAHSDSSELERAQLMAARACFQNLPRRWVCG